VLVKFKYLCSLIIKIMTYMGYLSGTCLYNPYGPLVYLISLISSALLESEQ
jgi:hypothetical protein